MINRMLRWTAAAILQASCFLVALPAAWAEDHGEGHAMAGMAGMEEGGAVILDGWTTGLTVTLIVLATLYFAVRMRGSAAWLPPMTGMMASMAMAMMAGLAAGTLLGITLGEMLLASALAVAIGLAAACLVGGPLGLLALLDGMLAGIMGGMMGAMLGLMGPGDHPRLSVWLVDLLFILVAAVLGRLLHSEARGHAAREEAAGKIQA